MAKVSIIISSRKEKTLYRTVKDIYDKVTGDFEVIVGFNGPPYTTLPFPYLRTFESPKNIGLKPMINELVKRATGKYIYKTDAHCSFGKGFDEILQADMEDDWVVTPRFYVLDGKTWKVQDDRFYDYFYLSCPFTDKKGLRFKAGGHWPELTKERLKSHPSVDETPSMHGSGWFVNRDYFLNEIGGFPEDDPFGHAQEPIWLGLKNWLIGGKLMVNKNTWYAHMHQSSNQRGYPEDKGHTERTYNEVATYWLQQEGFEAFVDKFMPMPSWTDDWRELYKKWTLTNT